MTRYSIQEYCFFISLMLCGCGIPNSLTAQSSIAFLDYDTVIYQRTIEQVYKSWNESEFSGKNQIDTILCLFIVRLDTNLEKNLLNDQALKESMSLYLIHTLKNDGGRKYKSRKKPIHKEYIPIEPNIYDCECEVYDLENLKIATISSNNNFFVFGHSKNSSAYSENLIDRIIGFKDKIVLRPTSKFYGFNFLWRAAIDENGELVWFHINDHKQNYSSTEVYKHHWDHFILSETNR